MSALLGLQQQHHWSLQRGGCMPLWETRPVFCGFLSGSNWDWAHVGTLVSSSLDPAQPLSWLLVALCSWPACLHTGQYGLKASSSFVGSTVTEIPSFSKIPSSWLIWLDLWGATALVRPLYLAFRILQRAMLSPGSCSYSFFCRTVNLPVFQVRQR